MTGVTREQAIEAAARALVAIRPHINVQADADADADAA